MNRRPPYVTDEAIATCVRAALKEDIGTGDYSSLSTAPSTHQSVAQLQAKADGIVAGVELAKHIFQIHDKRLSVTAYKNDGQKVRSGDIVLQVEGPSRAILSAERVTLNCIQRMSGIATYTKKLCNLIADTGARLLDTRKTTPNFRVMEKWAVAIGGGHNHRLGLYDKILIKDNHIAIAGGVEAAIRRARRYLYEHKKALAIEVETRTLDEVNSALRAGGLERIMLDNMDIEQIQKAVEIIGKRVKTEVSGNVTESALQRIAWCGVDYISMGRLTHSVSSLDMSLKISSAPAT